MSARGAERGVEEMKKTVGALETYMEKRENRYLKTQFTGYSKAIKVAEGYRERLTEELGKDRHASARAMIEELSGLFEA